MPILLLLALLIPQHKPTTYRARDGSYVRRPHRYKRHPNAGTTWSATCRDGYISFSHTAQGTCSHHHGVQPH